MTSTQALAAVAPERNQSDEPQQPQIPTRAFVALSLCLFSNAANITILFPFVVFMVMDFGLTDDEKEAGWYAGYIGAAIMLGRFFSSFLWGSFADNYGRKPVFYIGLVSLAITSILFGMSFNFWFACTVRFVSGLLNGIVAVGKATAAELVPPELQSRAMTLITTSWGFGFVFGPAIGGVLAHRGIKQFPYLLPMVINSVIALVALYVVWKDLPETYCRSELHTIEMTITSEDSAEEDLDGELDEGSTCRLVHHSVDSEAATTRSGDVLVSTDEVEDSSTVTEYPREAYSLVGQEAAQSDDVVIDTSDDNDNDDSEEAVVQTRREALCDSAVVLTISAYSMLSLVSILFNEVFSLWAATGVDDGGLGFNSFQIGVAMAVVGGAVVFCNLIIFPTLERRFGAIHVFRWSIFGAAVLFAFFTDVSSIHSMPPLLWTVLLLLGVTRASLTTIAFTSMFMLINNSVHTQFRASVNGLAMAVSSAFKALGPIIGANLYAWSVNSGIGFPVDKHFVYYLSALMLLLCFALSYSFPTTINQGKK